MLPLESRDRIHVAFDDHRLVTNAGLMLTATLALRLGLGKLVNQLHDFGHAPGRANTGDKLLTLVLSPWLAATVSTTLTRCVLAVWPGSWAVWSRRRPRWAPSCADSAETISANWTRLAWSCCPWLGPPGPNRVKIR